MEHISLGTSWWRHQRGYDGPIVHLVSSHRVSLYNLYHSVGCPTPGEELLARVGQRAHTCHRPPPRAPGTQARTYAWSHSIPPPLSSMVTMSKLLDSGSLGLTLQWAYSSAYFMALLCQLTVT